jgi:hypothetical protein
MHTPKVVESTLNDAVSTGGMVDSGAAHVAVERLGQPTVCVNGTNRNVLVASANTVIEKTINARRVERGETWKNKPAVHARNVADTATAQRQQTKLKRRRRNVVANITVRKRV